MAIDLSPAPFTWGAGGARMTPEAIASQRKVAQAMMQQGMDYSPIQSPWQGAARVAQAMLGGLESGQADVAAKANSEAEAKLLSELLSGGGSTPVAAPATPATAAATMGSNAIPAGQPDASLTDAISKVAAARGVDPAYMTRLAMVESGGKLNANSPLSSASGPFQFLNSTARQYGLTNPMDPAASSDAAARLTLDNKAALTQALGREPTPGELYLAHQQGSGGAINLLRNPNAPVEEVIGPAAARNNGAKPGMTAGQFASKWTGKFGDIVQTVDPAQKNILDAAADGPTMTAQADPAALPVNAQAAQGFAIPGQGATAAAPGVNPALVRAMSSPYVSDGTKKILGLLLTQQMAAAQKANDPGHQLDMKYKQAQIDKINGKAGTTEYGLNPVYGKDPETGATVIGTLGKDGSFKKIDTGGVQISSGIDKIDLGTHFAVYDKKSGQFLGNQPKDLKGAEVQKAVGKAQGAAQASLPGDIQNAQSTITQIDDLIKHPGLSAIVGPLDQFRPNWTMGAEGRDALARFNQLKGKAFLQAYTTLRGGGQITEVEGAKAENAMARMDRAQSEAEFTTALTDFRDAVKTGMDKLREKAGVAAPGGKTSSGVSWSVE